MLMTKGSPQVFAFHGTGGDEHQFAALVADLWPHAGLIAPRGAVSENGANRFFRRTGEGRYDMADLAARTMEMIDFVRQYKTGPAYAFGYSNGANILAAMSFAVPDLFDGITLLHPLIPFDPPRTSFGACRITITAGRNDPICPLPETERLATYYRECGADVSLVLHDGGHEIRRNELVALKEMVP